MPITPEQARAELNRRAAQTELSRRGAQAELDRRESIPTFGGGQGGEFGGTGATGDFGESGIGFVESTKEEFTRPAKGAQYVPLVGGIIGAAESLHYLDAAGRLTQNFDYSKPISPEVMRPGAAGLVPAHYGSKQKDIELISDLFRRVNEQQERGYATGGQVAKGLLQLPTWMAEFAMTGGLASLGDELAQTAGTKLLRRYAETKAGQMALKTMGWTGGAITRSTLGLTSRVGEKAIQRQVDVQVLGGEEEGWATSFAKAWGDVTIEAASESAGEAITGIPIKLLNKTKLGKKFIESVQSAWIKSTGGSVGKFARTLAKRGGYSNIIGEIGEERLGTILRAITGVDDFGTGKDSSITERLTAGLTQDARNFGVEAIVLSVPMAGQVALGKAASAIQEVVRKGERYVDSVTGEDVILDTEASGSAIVPAEVTTEFPATEAEVGIGERTTDQGKGPGLDRAVTALVEEGMTLEDAQTVVRSSQEGGRATKDITKSTEMREKLLEVERAIEPDEQNPKKVEHKDKLEMPEFNEPGVAAIITNKRKVMDRIGAFKIKGFAELFSNFEKMQHLKGNLRKVVNKTIRVLNKQATLGDKISRRIMKRSTKPVRRIVDLLDTYERLPAEIADELSKTEVEAFNAMRDITKWLLERANVARKKMGLKPINDLKGYIPHWTKALATEVLSGKYVHKSGYVAELMKNVPKVIDNPTAYQRIFREINQKIQDHMESDLGKLMHGLINYDLHDIMLANPLAETWEQLRELRDTRDSNGNRVISDRAYKYIADYLNYDILKKQVTADRIFNEAKVVKTVTQMINKVLGPINREISNPAASFFGGLRKVWHAAFMPFRLRNITRNFGQRLLNLSFHRYRDLGRAQFGKQDTITHPVTGKKIKVLDYVREQDWYKITKPEDTLDDGTLLSNLTQYGMIGFKTSHVGNRYASNVEVSAISSYYDWKHRFEQSHTMSSAHYKNIVEVSKRTGIPIENLQTQEVDMMNDIRDGVAKTQWEYMAHCLPTIIRGQSGRALAAYQSWWMNYYTAFLAEGYHNLITGRTRVRSDGTGGRLLTPGARYRVFKGMGGIYGAARIAQDVFGLTMLGALWMPDPTNGLPPLLSLVVSMISLMTGFRTPEKRKRAWKDLVKTLRRMMPFSSAAREIARVGDDWTLKDYVFYTKNEEWQQIWVPVTTKSKPKKGGL